jgi:beta-lactam-binding protein with PASTA domain
MKRFFNLLLGALAMLAVALTSAFIAMRLAIHGREVVVPNLAGLSIADASHKAHSLGLSLNLENKFYSPDTPPGNVLAQSPSPGSKVRREWAVRITESLGAQQVSVPNLIGQTERAATINLRRLSLDLGSVAHIASPGEPGIVLAQSPPPTAQGADRPQVSLLLSEPEDSQPDPGVVMPSLTGLTLSAAYARATSAGLHIVSAEDVITPTPATPATPTATTPPPAAAPTTGGSFPPNEAAFAVSASVGTVIAQSPPAGHRVAKGEPVRLTLSH